jgi:hypothetical protein
MDSPQSPQPFSQSKRLRTGIIFVALALLAVVIIGIARSSKKPTPEPPLVWLDQTQFARQMQPGRLKRLYYKVVSLTAPVWQRFRRPKTHIQIAAKILAAQGVTTGQFGIGTAIATNDSGTQVWILSAAELNDLRQRLPTNRFEVVSAPSIITEDGLSASIFSGQALPQTSAWIGVSMYVSPKIASHELQLAINAFYTEPNDSPTIPVRTNISAACRVRLPNAGGVLITSPAAKDAYSTNYWLILSPTAVDGYGNPIKL